jgi:1A family penicillin-binding protein
MNWQRAWKVRRNRLKRRIKKGKLFPTLAALVFFCVLGGVLSTTLLFAWYARDLPRPDKIVRKEGFATRIYDRNEELLYDVYGEQKRTPVELSEIPDYLKQATVAIEDKDFYEHKGFDVRGWLRAVYNIIFKRRLQGGSTITQQLVKNVLLNPERTIPRKIKEFILAIQIEKKYSKDEILQMYLNEVPFGGTAWGVEAAAETYFGKKVSELDLVESAVLAGLPRRPTAYSPFGSNPKAYILRSTDVLRRMKEDGYISEELEDMAVKKLEEVEFASPQSGIKAPHFIMYVKEQLVERYGEKVVEQGGLKVVTTLDWELQEKAQEIVAQEIEKVEFYDITNGAAMVFNPQTGEILSMVGSKNYDDPDYDGQVNVCLSLRQPGSAIKPVTYVTAFKRGYTPSTLIMDVKTEFPGGTGQPAYIPENYDGEFHGPLQIRYALGSSINIPAVKMLAMVGVEDMLETAYSMGFTTLKPSKKNLSRFGLSLTLGGGEIRLIDMVSAYSAFANSGLKVEPISILRVEDRHGKVLEEFKPVEGKQVLSPQEAYLISHILMDNQARLITFGEINSLRIDGHQVAAKTGTTDDKRDNWTVGWNPRFVAGVWVGNNDNSSMKRVASGVTGAAPIWRKIVIEAIRRYGSEDFVVPAGIVTADVDKLSGYRVHDDFPSRTEYFIEGTEPQGEDLIHAKLRVCQETGLLASEVCEQKGLAEDKEFFVFDAKKMKAEREEWQKWIDDWLLGQEDERYHPPTEECTSYHSGETESISVYFDTPSDHQELSENEFVVDIRVISPHEVVKVELEANGENKETWTGGPFRKTIYLDDGTYTLKAKAVDSAGNAGEAEIKIGVKVPWDWEPEPTPTPTPTEAPATPTPSPTPAP